MKEQLGLPEGILTRFNGNRALQWIRLGGTLEDAGTRGGNVTGTNRYFRHFHDPLLPWDRSGLFYVLTLPPRLTRFESSVRWAQLENQDTISGFGNFSWRDARRYFKTALTDPDATVREQAFADTFRALGHVMHLIVDASVPEHVRNDIHPMGALLDMLGLVGNYEYWVLAQHEHSGTQPGFIRDFLSTPIELDEEVLRIPIPDSESVAQAPIARLFDSDRYTGDNPEVTAEPKIGIAELANANFFSEDTHRGEYPHPTLGNLETFTRIYSQNGQERTYYRKRVAGLAVEPIAAECALADPTQTVSLCPDEDVWRETARHMLPRAVRYSREVLDYFFRGTVDFTIGGSSSNQTLTITNKTDEVMEGTFTLYTDNSSDVRTPVAGASFNLTLGSGATSGALNFTPPAEVQAYTLVFQGKLGLEDGAVAAKVNEWYAVTDVNPSTITAGQPTTLTVTLKSKFTGQPRNLTAALFDANAAKLASNSVTILETGPATTKMSLDITPTAIPNIAPRPLSLVVGTDADIASVTWADLRNEAPVSTMNLARVGQTSRLPIYQRFVTPQLLRVLALPQSSILLTCPIPGVEPESVTLKFKNAGNFTIQYLATDDDYDPLSNFKNLTLDASQAEFQTVTVKLDNPVDEFGRRAVNHLLQMFGDLLTTDAFVCIQSISGIPDLQFGNCSFRDRWTLRECPE